MRLVKKLLVTKSTQIRVGTGKKLQEVAITMNLS
jgi:hypothetical protein